MSHPKQLWLSVLLKDTSAATSHAEILIHILTTWEPEDDVLDHSATTLHNIHASGQFKHNGKSIFEVKWRLSIQFKINL